jgi:hypothetical protein
VNADVLDLLRRYPRLTREQVDALLGLEEPPTDDNNQGDGDQDAQLDTGATLAPLLLIAGLGFLVTRRRR